MEADVTIMELFRHEHIGPVRWLVLVLVWAGWCWFFVRGKHCWLAGLGWLKPTSEQADSRLWTSQTLKERQLKFQAHTHERNNGVHGPRVGVKLADQRKS